MSDKSYLCCAKKYIPTILLVMLLSFAIELMVSLSLPPKYVSSKDNFLNFPSTLEIAQTGYELRGNIYRPLNEDPQLSLSMFSADLYGIMIEFDEGLQDDTTIQVYFLDENNVLTESSSVLQIAQKGSHNVTIELPPDRYDFLRIDINGEFSLKGIFYTDQPLVKEKVPEQIYWNQLIAITIIVAMATVLIVKLGISRNVKSCLSRFIDKMNLPKFIPFIKFICFLACVAIISERIIFGFLCDTNFRFSHFCLIFLFLFAPLAVYRFRKQIGKHVEIGFLIISLSLGILLITTIPGGPLVSWDDGIHFENTIGVAGLGVKRMTAADDTVIARTFPLDFTPEVIDRQNEILEYEFSGGTLREEITGFQYNQLGYLPAAFGIFLGRLFHCPYHVTFSLGKLFNLFVYVALVYSSIKKLKSGKVILSIIALFPTNLFLATNYSYDPWVTAWFMLGASSFISELQQPDKLLDWKSIWGMIVPFFLGCGPKAVYAPFILILLTMPRSKFTSDKQRKCFRICVLCTVAVVLLSFLVPFFLQVNSGEFVGDTRGGSDVDSREQVMFILKNPVEYAAILLGFLFREYLTLEASSMYMTSFAYLGMTGKHVLLVVALAVAVFTDKSEYDGKVISWKFRLYVLTAFFITACAVASALYVSFTPVGNPTVNGCQLRYLLPILFPLYYSIGSPSIQNRIDRNLYSITLLAVPAYITFSAILSLAYSDLQVYFLVGMLALCLSLFVYERIKSDRKTKYHH